MSLGQIYQEGSGTRVPKCDLTDPGSIEAWFGPYGFSDHFRKVVLSSCKEAARAKFAAEGKKLSEDRADDLARLDDNYIDFLISALEGRRRREAMALERIGL